MDLPDVYTPEQIAELELRGACPYWQRVNPRGWCVEKWWSGGLAARALDGLAVVAGMAVLGIIVAEASKIKRFQPAIDRLRYSTEQTKFLRNRRGHWRAGRTRRGRR